MSTLFSIKTRVLYNYSLICLAPFYLSFDADVKSFMHTCTHTTYVIATVTYTLPVPVPYSRVAEDLDEWQVLLELLQSHLDAFR